MGPPSAWTCARLPRAGGAWRGRAEVTLPPCPRRLWGHGDRGGTGTAREVAARGLLLCPGYQHGLSGAAPWLRLGSRQHGGCGHAKTVSEVTPLSRPRSHHDDL